MLPALALGFLAASCVDDKGSYDYTPINEVSFEDIESVYNAIQGFTELEIDPKVTGDIYGKDLDNYEFQWHLCRAGIGDSDSHRNHRFLGDEKTLKWLVDEPVGDYTIYFTVTDKTSGLSKYASTTLSVKSSFARGFMLLGTDGDDDLIQMDMLAMPAAGDTAIVENAFVNNGSLRKPRKIFDTGAYQITPECDFVWLFAEDDSWQLSPKQTEDNKEFDVMGTFASLDLGDNEYEIYNERCVGLFPKRAASAYNVAMANLFRSTSLAMTEKCCYGPVMSTYSKNHYTAAVNRMANNPSSPLFNFYPEAFYNGSLTSMMWISTPFIIYDTDHDKFVIIQVTGLNGTHCADLPNLSYNPAWQWDCRNEGRKLVYGEVTSTPGRGYSCFVIKSIDNDTDYWIYSLQIASAATQTREIFPGKPSDYAPAPPIDLALVKDFDKAEKYAFIGCRRAVFYSVGSVLHQYDFERGYHMEMDMGAQITMIKADPYSILGRHNNLMVATWDDAAKQGEFMNLKIGDNPNSLSMEIRNDVADIHDNPLTEYVEKWPTRLKIVDAEWHLR